MKGFKILIKNNYHWGGWCENVSEFLIKSLVFNCYSISITILLKTPLITSLWFIEFLVVLYGEKREERRKERISLTLLIIKRDKQKIIKMEKNVHDKIKLCMNLIYIYYISYNIFYSK